MTVIPADDLRDLVIRIFLTAGADEDNARTLAEHLVLANLSGVDTHGVWHVAGYVDHIRKGYILPTARPAIIQESPNSAQVTGNWTFGQVAARFAMETAIEKAGSHEMAVVGLVQSHHIGRLGHYTEMAAARGLISMVWAGGFGEEEPVAVPYGGRERLLHTNPIAMGFPGGDAPSMAFDFATTVMSGVKVLNAQRRSQKLPPGSVVDKEGSPSADPNDFFDGGGQIPFGGHKGYALMMAVEFLGRILNGTDAFADPERAGPIMRYQGVCMVVFKADLFQPFSDYARRADEMVQRTRAVPPAPGFEEVLVPGDPEVRTRNARGREGIPIEDDIWQTILGAADDLGIKDIPHSE